MRIAIDISQIIYETGVSVYTKELVGALCKLYPECRFVLFGGSLRRNAEIGVFADRFANAKAVLTLISPSIADFLWNRLHVVNIEKFTGEVDVFHTSDWSEPPALAPKVTTIHDLSFLHYPRETSKKILDTHRRRLHWVKKESSAVIVPSKATKEDAMKLGIREDKIHVIPEAPSKIYKKQTSARISVIKRKYKITGEYALAVGAAPRKNLPRIINAFEKAKVESGLSKLVVVGRGDRENTKNVMFLGHVEACDLPALYSGASILVYTSLYEGFGLPVLEAFSCGTPVLTSNVSSMPEVAGKAAVLVDPEITEEIAKGIIKTLEKKKELVASGKEEVKKFSWERTARETMGVYEDLVKQYG